MLKPLTPEEVVQVSLATRGECYAHRRWPEEVVRAFAAAQVIIIHRRQIVVDNRVSVNQLHGAGKRHKLLLFGAKHFPSR